MYQLQGLDQKGAVSALAATEYPLLVIEPGNTLKSGGVDTAGMLSALRTTPSGRTRVILAYIDVGEAESYRSYWGADWVAPTADQRGAPDFLLTTDPDGWSGNYPVAYWHRGWQDLWLSDSGIVKTLARLGVDGVYLDWVEGYDDAHVQAVAAQEGVDAAQAMIDFVAAIRAAGRSVNPDFLVVAQNAIYLIDRDPDRYASNIDALGVEDTWFYGTADAPWDSPQAGDQQGGAPQSGDYSTANRLVQYRKYLQRGLPVFTIDYCVQTTNAAWVYQQARQAGVRPLVTRVSLSKLTETPPDSSWHYAFLGGVPRADGARRIPIAAAGSLQNPAFSPEGWSLLFTSFQGGYNAGAADLCIQDLGGSALRTLVSNGTANVNLPGSCWNPRTRRVVFSSSRDPHDEVYQVFEWGTSGGESQVTNRAGEVAFEPSLSPDGTWVVFESHAEGDATPGSVMTTRADGSGGYVRLTSVADDCRQPVWSPLRDLIVYQKRTGGEWGVWITRPDGTGQRQVTSGVGEKTDPSFSPDGRWIVYSSTEGGLANANLFAIPVGGGTPTRVTTYGGYDGAPAWSPDGKWIAFESFPRDPDGGTGTTLWVIAAPALPAGGAGGTPAITRPTPGSTLTSPVVTLEWNPQDSSAAQYWLQVGTTAGGKDLFDHNMGTNLSATVAGLPLNGKTLYVRLFYLLGGTWRHLDATYGMTSGGVAPTLVRPTPGSTLTSSTTTFEWSSGAGVTQYWLTGGTFIGGHDVFSQNEGMSLAGTVNGLPTNGNPLYVRLWYHAGGTWQHTDTTYRLPSVGATPTLTSPLPGSTLASSSVVFRWSPGAVQYWLQVGTTVGGADLLSRNEGGSLSDSVADLPTDGSTLYVRLWYLIGGRWRHADVTYAASDGE